MWDRREFYLGFLSPRRDTDVDNQGLQLSRESVRSGRRASGCRRLTGRQLAALGTLKPSSRSGLNAEKQALGPGRAVCLPQ